MNVFHKQKFTAGQKNSEDETVENQPHLRRRRTSLTSENTKKIQQIILDNRRLTISEISEEVGINAGSVENIGRNKLHLMKWRECMFLLHARSF